MTTQIRPATVRLETSRCALSGALPEGDPLGLMASSMAHDLNNILQIVSGNLSLMARDDVADAARRRIDTSLAALRSGAELTSNVLEYCRQRTSSAPREGVITAGHLAAMQSLLSDAVGGAVELTVDVPDVVWAFRSNIHRLQNALLNLAINARDAMDGRGRMLVCVRNVTCPRRGDQIWVSVADEGPGIAPDILEQIFEPFYTTKPHGTGLGLAIVAEFARASNADVAIDSRPGLGTRITIEFPRWA